MTSEEQKLADTFLSVLFRFFERFSSLFLGFLPYDRFKGFQTTFQAVLVPPPKSVVTAIKSNFGYYLSPGPHPPAFWERLKQAYCQKVDQVYIQLYDEMRDHPLILGMREVFQELWQRSVSPKPELYSQGGVKQPKKLKDAENEVESAIKYFSENPRQMLQAFPPQRVLDPRYYKVTMEQVGTKEQYARDVTSFLYDLYRGAAKPRITTQSEIWTILNLDGGEIRKAPMEVYLPKLLRAASDILFLNEDEVKDKSFKLIEWEIKSCLPKIILGEGSGVYKRRKERPLDENRISVVTKSFKEVEERLDLDIALEELPAAQREDMNLYREAYREERMLEELCAERGKSYGAVRKNIHMAKRTLQKSRRLEGYKDVFS